MRPIKNLSDSKRISLNICIFCFRYFVIVSKSSLNIDDRMICLQAEKICKDRQNVGLSGLVFESKISNEVNRFYQFVTH